MSITRIILNIKQWCLLEEYIYEIKFVISVKSINNLIGLLNNVLYNCKKEIICILYQIQPSDRPMRKPWNRF